MGEGEEGMDAFQPLRDEREVVANKAAATESVLKGAKPLSPSPLGLEVPAPSVVTVQTEVQNRARSVSTDTKVKPDIVPKSPVIPATQPTSKPR